MKPIHNLLDIMIISAKFYAPSIIIISIMYCIELILGISRVRNDIMSLIMSPMLDKSGGLVAIAINKTCLTA